MEKKECPEKHSCSQIQITKSQPTYQIQGVNYNSLILYRSIKSQLEEQLTSNKSSGL